MNLTRILSFVYILLCFYACSPENHRRIIVNDLYAEGDIDEDTIYNGLIKFYDTSTHILVSFAHYKNDSLHGLREDYYPSGVLESKIYYENDEPHGFAEFFNLDGKLQQKQYAYYGLKVGPVITFKNGNPATYSFNSFENVTLINFAYDTIQNKRIDRISDEFFFFDLITHNDAESSDSIIELFIYLPDPPGFDFKYSLTVIGEKYEVKRVIKQFNGNKVFDKIDLDFSSLRNEEKFAIKLQTESAYDTSGKATMFKKIKYP